MGLTRVAIVRPVFMLMVISALVILGLVAFSRLNAELYPSLNIPAATVVTNYPGAAPDDVERLITRPIEDAVAGVPNVDTLVSTSTEGSSQVQITFSDTANPDVAATDVERRVSAIRGSLPIDATAPSVLKFDPSGPSRLSRGVEVLELDAGVGGSETPINRGRPGVALGLPGGDLTLQRGLGWDTAAQALTREDAELQLRDVEPTAVDRGGVECELVRQALGLGRWEGRVERARRVRVEVVEHQHDALGLGIVLVDQLLDQARPVAPGALGGDANLALAAERLAGDEHIRDAVADVLVVVAGLPPGPRRAWLAALGDQLDRQFIQANQRPPGIQRAGVNLEQVVHPPDEVAIGLRREAPAFGQPGLQDGFFSGRRTVSYDRPSMNRSATRVSARRCSVQRRRPRGGGLQARAIKRASSFPSSLRRYTRSGGLRASAPAGPCSRHRLRTRQIVASPTSKARAIAASGQAGPAGDSSALSRMRAWVSARAAPRPLASCRWRSARSSSVRCTRYFVAMVRLLQHPGHTSDHP